MESFNTKKGPERILILLRHGVSHPLNKLLSDFNRSLTEQGENSFLEKIEKMQNSKIFPDYNPEIIISSPSKRTMQTSQLFLSKLKLDIQLETNLNLYQQTNNAILDTLSNSEKLTDEITVALVVAHNPLLENFTYRWDPHFQKTVSPGTFLFFKSNEMSWKNAILNPWSLFLHY